MYKQQQLAGRITEIRFDDRRLTLELASRVSIEVGYDGGRSEIEKEVEQLWEGLDARAVVVITGWKSMPYPHLSHDVMEGTLIHIEEIDDAEST